MQQTKESLATILLRVSKDPDTDYILRANDSTEYKVVLTTALIIAANAGKTSTTVYAISESVEDTQILKAYLHELEEDGLTITCKADEESGTWFYDIHLDWSKPTPNDESINIGSKVSFMVDGIDVGEFMKVVTKLLENHQAQMEELRRRIDELNHILAAYPPILPYIPCNPSYPTNPWYDPYKPFITTTGTPIPTSSTIVSCNESKKVGSAESSCGVKVEYDPRYAFDTRIISKEQFNEMILETLKKV